MSNVTWDTHRALINSFAEYGRILLPLRSFCLTKHQVHLVQAFQDSVYQCLRAFDRQIALIQQRFVEIKEDTIVSLIALEEEIRPHLTPISALSNVVRQLQEERFAHTFRFLELLYDNTCLAQLSGDERTYAYLGEIFFDCFRVYIRPIRQWMEGGELTSGDLTFFVAEAADAVPMSHIWSSKFKLRRSEEGQLHAPQFLQPAVRKIFNTGKSIVVLKHLGRFQHPKDHPDTALPEPLLDFQTVCGAEDVSFAPFAELFEGAFDCWVQSKYLSASSNLQAILFEFCGLGSSLDALQLVYLMSDGSLADTFTSSVFASLDANSTAWTDRFTLTELAQEAWSPSCVGFEDYRLSVSVAPEHIFRSDPYTARCSVRNSLPGVQISYNLAWPVRLVLTKEAISGYQSTFTLLLQLRRAASILTTSSALLKSQQDDLSTDELAAYHGLRARLMWFVNTFQSYLTTLVLVPEVTRMRVDIHSAEDLDDMVEIHAAFTKRMIEEACLGPKLAPIRECLLDILDLAVKLEDARQDEMKRKREVTTDGSTTQQQQQAFSTPKRNQQQQSQSATDAPPPTVLRGLYISPKEKEREEDNNTMLLFGRGGNNNNNNQHDSSWDESILSMDEGGAKIADILGQQRTKKKQQTYAEAVSEIRADFDRHLRFIAGGLRGVARASADAAATKWDILAEMLEMGIRDR